MTTKPQDPERDDGFGTCEDCHEGVAASWAKYGFISVRLTLDECRARLAKYA